MLLEMGIGKRVHSMDCIALDGGYTQYLGDLMEKEKDLKECNFCFPIRKKRQQPLYDDEANFNAIFGGFVRHHRLLYILLLGVSLNFFCVPPVPNIPLFISA